MAATIKINGKEFPAPDKGLTFEVATVVNAGRNADGEFVGQRVGREQYKLDALQWRYLDAKTWSGILKEFEQFTVTVTFPDMVENGFKTLLMYPGNRTAQPLHIDTATGLPRDYVNCQCNIIDCGVL